LYPPAVVPKTKATIGYEFKTEPSCIHYKHSKVLLAIYGRKMNAKNISSISLKLLGVKLKRTARIVNPSPELKSN
jgi:hypothetical protein